MNAFHPTAETWKPARRLWILGLMLSALTLLPSCGRTPTAETNWAFTFQGVDGDGVLDMTGVTIVFKGEDMNGTASGQVRVSGGGSMQMVAGGGDRTFRADYKEGVNAMQFRRFQFQLVEGGSQLRIQGKTVDLTSGKPVVTVAEDGTLEVSGLDVP